MAAYNTQTNARLANLSSPFLRRTPGGSVTIYNKNLHGALVEDVNCLKGEHNSLMTKQRHSVNADGQCGLAHHQKQKQLYAGETAAAAAAGSSCSSRSSITIPSRLSSVSTADTMSSSHQLDPKSCLKMLKKSDPEFKVMKQAYEDLLEAEYQNSMDMEEFNLQVELLKIRKKEILHRRWTDNVYDPVMRSVYGIVYPPHGCSQDCAGDATDDADLLARCSDCLLVPSLDKNRLSNYNDYLAYVNKRGFAFLDTCQACDYCPVTRAAPAETGRLKDPTLFQDRQRLREKADILRCMCGSKLSDREVENIILPPLPATSRPSTTWKALSNTHLSDVDSSSRCASRMRMYPSRNSSAVDLTFTPAPLGNPHRQESRISPCQNIVTATVACQTCA